MCMRAQVFFIEEPQIFCDTHAQIIEQRFRLLILTQHIEALLC